MTNQKKSITTSSNEALKKQLIDGIAKEKNDFSSLLQRFYSNTPRTTEEYIELTRAIVTAVDRVLETPGWEDSLFLRNVLKPLQKLREEANLLQAQVAGQSSLKQTFSIRPLKEDEVRVYISVFQSEGDHLGKWALQLASLRSHLLGRPIYESEEDVQKIIRQKIDQHSEGYVVAAVKRSDIQEPSPQMKRFDRYGNPLITLRETGVSSENILEFVCQGNRYFYQNGRLILQNANAPAKAEESLD